MGLQDAVLEGVIMKQVHSFLHAWAHQTSFLALAAMFLGCSGAAMAAGLSGTAMTGKLPLTNATVKLWQVSTTGYGQGDTLVAQAATNSSGQWSISTITCSPANSEVFVIARSGFGGGPIRILAFLGPCNALPSNVAINEVTSIAAIWALQQFMLVSNSGSIGAPSTNPTGLANAGLNAANLANVTTGTTPGSTLPPGATAPIAKINTLADIMAACDVTGGPPSTPCTSLFSAATPPGGAAPTDTYDAMLDVALFPVNNVNELFALIGTTPPFNPVIPASPTDWTLAVNYANNGLDAPGTLAIDASGNIWVPNALGNSLSKFNAAGRPLSGGGLPGFNGGGLNIPFAVAIDSNGNAWVTNEGNNSLSEFSSDGTAMSPADTGFTGGGLEDPEYLAIDSSNNVWVANCGNFCDKSGVASNVSEFNSAGKALTPTTGLLGGGLDGASGIALDKNGNVWVANEGNNSLSEFNSSGMAVSPPTGFTGGGLDGPVALAVSSTNFIWVTDQLGNAVSEFASNGEPATGPAGTTGGGIVAPLGIAIDSSHNKWIANSTGIAEISVNTVTSPSTGFVDPNNDEPNGAAIDASGNVWVTNTHGNSLSEFVGVAAPVKTPLIGLPTLP